MTSPTKAAHGREPKLTHAQERLLKDLDIGPWFGTRDHRPAMRLEALGYAVWTQVRLVWRMSITPAGGAALAAARSEDSRDD